MRRDDSKALAGFAKKSAWLVLLMATPAPPPLHAQVNCQLPGRNSPAVPVPECVDATGGAVTCNTPNAIRLWPNDFRPAGPIPLIRDSTDRIAGKTIPGMKSGHELFSTVDVVTVAGVSRRLYVAYNAGIQAWDILANPANPGRLDARDGWEGHFLSFPEPSEVLTFVLDIAALNVGAHDLVMVSGNDGVGPSLWELNTSTNQFRAMYQDPATDSKEVRLIQRNDGIVYGFAASVSDGLAVYNVSAARNLSPPCLDSQGSNCPTVYRGRVTNGATSPERPNFVDAIHVPTSNKVFLTVSGGLFTELQIWELGNPQFPGTAKLRFSGFDHSAGSAIFKYDGHYYLAFITEELGLNNERLRTFMIDGCINGNTCTQADGSMQEAVLPIEVAPGFASAKDFLTYSQFDGDPYLYYSPGTGNLSGPNIEALFDASALRPPNGSPLTILPEITLQGGGSYTDPCNGSQIRYWSHHYHANTRGLNNMTPRHGKFSAAGYFYRAAASILDVHVKGGGSVPGDANIRTDVVGEGPFWMSDVIGFNTTVTGDCTPSAPAWMWEAETNRPFTVVPTEIVQPLTSAQYTFDCVEAGGARCLNATAVVEAANADCAEALGTPASLFLKDPRIDVVSTSTGGRSTFEACETIPLSANLAGRAPAFWEWRLDGQVIPGCSSSTLLGDLEEDAVVECALDGDLIGTDVIFADGFESGNMARWIVPAAVVASSPREKGQKLAVSASVDLLVWNTPDKGLAPRATSLVQFSLAETGIPTFSGSPSEAVDGPAATLTYPAVNATSWTWEIEDPTGEDLCSFPGKPSVNCVVEDTATSSITHFWPAAGTYSYRVTISNCSQVSDAADDEVTVESGVEPDITAFFFNSSNCCLDGLEFSCPLNVSVEFRLDMAEEGAFSFAFDWERSSALSEPNWTSQSATGKDPSQPRWFFSHTFTSAGTVYPTAQASSGILTDEEELLNGQPINIVNGACGGGAPD